VDLDNVGVLNARKGLCLAKEPHRGDRVGMGTGQD
jgi:hypothetical protein